MANVETAISIAVDNFIKKTENQILLAKINSAYHDLPDNKEQIILNAMRIKHRKIVKEKW